MASVLSDIPIPLNIQAVRKGIGWAQSWSTDPILVRIRNQKVQFIAVREQQFLASWAWALPGVTTSTFFLIPPFVAAAICNPSAYDADGLEVMVRKTLAGLIIRQGKQEFRLQWRWDPTTFQPPPTFEKMIEPSPETMRSPYVAIADIVHLAIANLGNIFENEDVRFEDAAIQIDFAQGQPNSQHYAFSPRYVMRGMEIARGEEVGFSMQQVERNRALLYFSTEREGCHIHCAILSLAQQMKDMPTTTLVIHETRPPMADGAWVLPRRK